MPQQVLDHAAFFQQLSALFGASQKKNSIWLTHKRLTYDAPEGDEEAEYPILIRATNGKGVEFSTRVEPGQLDRFHAEYGTLLKSSMTTLRKRDKKKEKQRADEIARKKKRLSEPMVIDGPKRGAGRRKRKRQIQAVLKQDQAKRRAEEREAASANARPS